MLEPPSHLLILGCGQVAKEVIKLAKHGLAEEHFRFGAADALKQSQRTFSGADGELRITATTRNPLRLFELVDLGIEPLILPLPHREIIEPLAHEADVIVTFPPDEHTDAILAPACAGARSITYISSTGVYGRKTGTIDDTTDPDVSNDECRPRLEAESIWREYGGVVLRAPGIYSPQNGMHKRLKAGTYKLPEGGENFSSRIELSDLARVILTVILHAPMNDVTYVLGDSAPCSQLEIVSWLCEQMEIPLPESVPLSEVNPTLRGNRAVNGSRILEELGMQLLYPSYKSGYAYCLNNFNGKEK